MEFEWDAKKAAANERKHRITFAEATTVFEDRSGILIFDEEHSEYEDRYRLLGLSDRGRLMVVTHTYVGENIRIVSARKPTKEETANYEKGIA